MTDAVTARFNSVRSIRRVLVVLLWATIAVALVALVLAYLERNVLYGIKTMSFPSREEMMAAAEASDRNVGIVGLIQVAVFLGLSIVWFMWIYRSNKLARALGASRMTYSPGWSVGWFFIPIANLFKPYFAMKEIYLATLDPRQFNTEQDVEDQPESLNILKLWWLVYLINRLVGAATLRTVIDAETLDQLIRSNSFAFAACITTMASALMINWLVREFTQKQDMAIAAAQSAPDPQTISVIP